jgi:hypothetical protein
MFSVGRLTAALLPTIRIGSSIKIGCLTMAASAHRCCIAIARPAFSQARCVVGAVDHHHVPCQLCPTYPSRRQCELRVRQHQ